MKYWTIVFPGEFGQHVQETWSEDQILKAYFPHWCKMMVEAGKGDFVNEQDCLNDWTVVHWAEETTQFGEKLK
jgi:hypothetical protein